MVKLLYIHLQKLADTTLFVRKFSRHHGRMDSSNFYHCLQVVQSSLNILCNTIITASTKTYTCKASLLYENIARFVSTINS
jgi:hypothetical protein